MKLFSCRKISIFPFKCMFFSLASDINYSLIFYNCESIIHLPMLSPWMSSPLAYVVFSLLYSGCYALSKNYYSSLSWIKYFSIWSFYFQAFQLQHFIFQFSIFFLALDMKEGSLYCCFSNYVFLSLFFLSGI